MASKLNLKGEENQPEGVQGRVCQLDGTDCVQTQTQEDQVYEELSTGQCG